MSFAGAGAEASRMIGSTSAEWALPMIFGVSIESDWLRVLMTVFELHC